MGGLCIHFSSYMIPCEMCRGMCCIRCPSRRACIMPTCLRLPCLTWTPGRWCGLAYLLPGFRSCALPFWAHARALPKRCIPAPHMFHLVHAPAAHTPCACSCSTHSAGHQTVSHRVEPPLAHGKACSTAGHVGSLLHASTDSPLLLGTHPLCIARLADASDVVHSLLEWEGWPWAERKIDPVEQVCVCGALCAALHAKMATGLRH